MLASRLLALPVQTAEMDPRAADEPLYPGEEAAVAGAIQKRRREYIAGRVCARRAMVALGERPAPVFQCADRAPIWPEGLVGSITHTDTWCAAAVARTADGVRALGLDIEPAEPIEPDLLRVICLPEERDYLAGRPAEQRGLLGRAIFSAKECAYKCQYAVSRTPLDFHAIRIYLDPPRGDFLAVFQRDAGPFSSGHGLRGHLLMENGYVMTAMALTACGTGATFPGERFAG